MELRRSSRIKALTQAVSPILLTSKRTRGHHVESQAEKEQKEYEEMMKYTFRARPPPDSAFQGSEPTGIPKKKSRKVTRAKTPMALKRKAATSRSRVTKAKNKGTNNAIKRLKALPLPDLKKVFELAKADAKITKPEPFSFENKYSKPCEIKEKLLKDTVEEEKKLREFKARILYESTGFQVDKNLSKSCTKVEPFNISKPNAYEEKLKKVDETLEKENLELQKKRDFKANYPHVIFEEPFIPTKDSRYCKIEEFDLHGEKRGYERKKFDAELEEQRLMLEKEKVNEEIEREKKEHKEVTELRKKMVHQANKVGEYKKQEYEDIS